MDAANFASRIRKPKKLEDRVACFGALLGVATRQPVEIVGGSAIEIYLGSSAYVSQDVDVVASRTAVEAALQRWGFRRIEGRGHRVYWADDYVGLVDIVGSADKTGLPPHRLATEFGPVLLSAREALIARRLMRFHREGSETYFAQALALARLGNLDWEYLRLEAKYESTEEELTRLRKALRPPAVRGSR